MTWWGSPPLWGWRWPGSPSARSRWNPSACGGKPGRTGMFLLRLALVFWLWCSRQRIPSALLSPVAIAVFFLTKIHTHQKFSNQTCIYSRCRRPKMRRGASPYSLGGLLPPPGSWGPSCPTDWRSVENPSFLPWRIFSFCPDKTPPLSFLNFKLKIDPAKKTFVLIFFWMDVG